MLDIHECRNLCKRLNAAVIHLHFGWLATDFLATTHNLGTPVLVSLYGSDVVRTSGRDTYLRRLTRLLQTPMKIVVESHFLRNYLVSMGATSSNLHVVPVGISLDELRSPDEVHTHREARLLSPVLNFITVGRLVDYKAPHRLPEVAYKLKQRGIRFQWNLIGDGPLQGLVQQKMHELGVEDCFHVLGSLPFDELKTLRWNSDIMIHNAVVAPDGGRECLGVVLLEAAAEGIPVVSCRVGGIPEAVAEGETALLAPEGDLDAMVEQIVSLCQNPSLRLSLGYAGLSRVRRDFDSSLLARKLEEVYDTLRIQSRALTGARNRRTTHGAKGN